MPQTKPDCFDIVAINRREAWAMNATGGGYPIEKWLDADGEECEEPEAVMAVAGFDYTWIWIDLRDFDGERQ